MSVTFKALADGQDRIWTFVNEYRWSSGGVILLVRGPGMYALLRKNIPALIHVTTTTELQK